MRCPLALIRLACLLLLALARPALAQGSQSEGSHEVVALPDTGGERPNAPEPDLSAVEQKIVEQTNAFRKDHGRDPVRPNEKLNADARQFARYMAEHGR